MHSIRRLSLRPLQDVSSLPRRLSDALLGPPVDSLPGVGGGGTSASSSYLALPRKLSLALIAPLLSTRDDQQHDGRLSPISDPSRSPLLDPSLGDGRPRVTPDLRSSPLPSGEKPNLLSPTTRKASLRPTTASVYRRRAYLSALLALTLALSVIGSFYLALPRAAAAAAAADTPSADDNSWLTWRPSGGSANASWLSWSSPSSTAGDDDDVADADVGTRDPFVERNLYRRFSAPTFVDISPSAERNDAFAAVELLNDACLESWIGQGVPCSRAMIGAERPKMELDVIFTWVNGSDPRWAVQHDTFLNQTPVSPIAPPARHYRSNKDELRHSVRSVMSYISPPPNRVHLVLGDWEDQSPSANSPGARRGQVPGWLDWNSSPSSSSSSDGRLAPLTDASSQTHIQAHFHSELFLSPRATSADEQAAHLRNATPNFNSFAIESQLHNIGRAQGEGGDEWRLANNIAYFNDDFFLLKKHTTADFATPLYGPTLRSGNPRAYTIPYWEEPAVGCEHEWSSLLRSNWLLSRRFGFRSNRTPLEHVAKTLSRPMLLEMHAIWDSYFATASERRFRETATGRFGDMNTSWLSSFLLVERARESMLWVWAVARLGGANGVWGAAERAEVRTLLGFAPDLNTTLALDPVWRPPTTVQVKRVHRGTLVRDTRTAAFAGLEIEGPKSTAYRWSSLDGYISTQAPCEIDLEQCFGDWWTGKQASGNASMMFAHLAFTNEGKCGDCLLTAIVGKSGGYGLSALLPANDTAPFVLPSSAVLVHPAGAPTDLQPHMPLTAEWTETSFELADVLAGAHPSEPSAPIDLRSWALRLIARYQYVDASTNAIFSMVTGPTNFGQLVEKLTADEDLVSLGMNDDIEERWEHILEPLVKSFLDTRFAVRGWWERLVL